jgi:lysyl-tRNA synthetase, class II
VSRAIRIGGRLLALPAALAVLFAVTGWLYLVGHEGGASALPVGDALPLDELSRHSSVPLLVFVGVWSVAAAVLGCIARLLALGRLAAALLLGLLVGSWSYLTTGVSILVVRQIAAESAFRDAGTLRAVLVPAVLAALAGALLARGENLPRARLRTVLAWFTAAAGALGVLDSIFPEHSRTLVAVLAPGARPLASALAAPFGLALLYVARGLGRGSRRAWQLALVLLIGSTVLHLAHSDYGALVTGGLAACLLARRSDFRRVGDPSARLHIVTRLALVVTSIFAYGIAALWANRLAADRPFSIGFALQETAVAAVGGTLRGHDHLSGPFGSWFGPSVLALALAGVASLLSGWLAPWRYRLDQDEHNRRVAREIVSSWGSDTLAPFVLRADKSYFFGPDERSLVAYRVVGGVAVASGDPLGPPKELAALVAAFIEHVRARGWRICVLGASEGCLELYRAHGLRALYHGDEAVLDVASFSLEGRAIRKVRQSVSRLRQAGYTAAVVRADDVDEELRRELESVRRTWRGHAPDRGYAMASDSLFRLEGDDAVFVVGRSADGAVQGFIHFAVAHAGRALSLSTMPRRRDTPNGLNEWLVCEAVAWAREHDFVRVSLNFAPFAALLAPEARLTRTQRVQRRLLLALKGHFQLDNLLLFNRKFFPLWEKRFVVFEHRRDLPRVGIAALAAESYLPFAGRRTA